MDTENALIARVLNAVPAASYAMQALVSLLRIDVTREVATASISCERRPTLRLNPDFVAIHCRSDEHLFLLVMHELHHVLLGHTRLFPRATRAHNVAFDAVINALLCAQFRGPAYASFFLEIYGAEESALRLLAPPGEVAPRDPVLAELHRMLYTSGQTTAEEIFRKLARGLAPRLQGERTRGGREPADDNETDECAGDAPLLGTHGDAQDEDWGTEGPLDPDVLAAVRTIVERWPPPADPIRGRSLSEALRSDPVKARSPASQVLAAMRRALRGAAVPRGLPRRHAGLAPARVALPDLRDRHAAVLRAAGRRPLLFESLVTSRRTRRAAQTHVYLDVSGSMAPYVDLLYGALGALRHLLAPNIHLFSTVVRTIDPRALRGGVCESTGGTDLACVLEHAARNGVRSLLVITDGYVGAPTAAQRTELARVSREVRVLLTPAGWPGDLAQVAARIETLPAVEGEG
jgi:hypothetical protein